MPITDHAIYTDAATLSMESVNWVHDIQAWSWDAGAIFADGKGINQIDDKEVMVGRATTWDFDLHMSTGATEASAGSSPDDWAELSNLDVTTITIGGTAYVTRCKNVAFNIQNKPTKTDGKAINDIDGYPVRGRRSITFDIDLMEATGDTDSPIIYALAKEVTRANLQGGSAVCYGAYSFVIGNCPIAGSASFSKAVLKVTNDDIQILTLSLTNRGLPSTLATGNLFTVAACATPPVCAFDFRTGRNTMSGNAFIHSLRGTANDQAIISMSGRLQARGTVTYGTV